MLTINPNIVNSFPGARIKFNVSEDGSPLLLSTLVGASVEIYFPGQHPALATIHESDHTFSWVVPISEGEHEVKALVVWQDSAEWVSFRVKISSIMSISFSYMTSLQGDPTGDVIADLYDPLGHLVSSVPMFGAQNNYSATFTPQASWLNGEYRVAVRDDTGIIYIDSKWIEKPSFASMRVFFNLPNWQRQIIEYLKYEMMGDTHELHPAAIFTLEEYAKHWIMTVGDINPIIPPTSFQPEGIPMFWGNVMLKGTLLRVYHALANRSVTIPRFSNLNAPIQDESHFQQSWESRYQALRPEYEEERNYMKAAHLPNPAITVDPFLGWRGGNLAGTSGLALIGRPNWFNGVGGMR